MIEEWDSWVKTCGEPTVWCGFDWPQLRKNYVVLPHTDDLIERCRDQAIQIADRTRLAHLVEEMVDRTPWGDHMWSRAALTVAARTIRRGRHLTDEEKLENMMKALAEEEDDNLTGCNHWPGQIRCGVCGMGGGRDRY